MPTRKPRQRATPADSKHSKPAQPSPDEQSGSTGRAVPEDSLSKAKDTGQDHYGQSGFAGSEADIERSQRSRAKK